MPDKIKLVLSILFCEGAGIVGSVSTTAAIPAWYATLQKPSFNPPNWLFAPVWILLYLLMGTAFYLIWQKGFHSKNSKIALGLFVAQLILNTAWSLFFFGYHFLGLALVEIIILWISIFLTILSFWKISKSAALLLLPYLLWVSFATLLNFSIFQLNS